MPTLALPECDEIEVGPSFGTGSDWQSDEDATVVHGSDFSTMLQAVRYARQRAAGIGRTLATQHVAPLAYDPVPPQRSYFACVTFTRGGRIPPMQVDHDCVDE